MKKLNEKASSSAFMGLPSLASEAKEANRMALPSLLSSALQHQHPSIQQHNQQFLNNNFKNSGHPVPRATSPGLTLSRDENQAKRSRTQINNGQQTALQSIFDLYRSPSLIECELIGSGVGLPKRVVQVWFQNHRAKERKLRQSQGLSNEPPTPEPPATCPQCDPAVPISSHSDLREHLFSTAHIQRLRIINSIGSNASSPTPLDSSPVSLPNFGLNQMPPGQISPGQINANFLTNMISTPTITSPSMISPSMVQRLITARTLSQNFMIQNENVNPENPSITEVP